MHTPSRFVADQVVAELGVDPERVRAVHHGIPTLGPVSSADGAPFSLPEGCRRYVLAIGTIEPRKDYPLLVSAFTAVSAAHPDVALVVVGGDGWGADGFLAAVASSPVRDRILRPGYLDDTALAHALGRCLQSWPIPRSTRVLVSLPCRPWRPGCRWWPPPPAPSPKWSDKGPFWSLRATSMHWPGLCAQVLDGGSAIADLVERGRQQGATFSWEVCGQGLARLYADAASASSVAGAGGVGGGPRRPLGAEP